MATDRDTAQTITDLVERVERLEVCVFDDSEPEPDQDVPDPELPETVTVDGLVDRYTRDQLDAIARSEGVENPDRLANKRVVAEHIVRALESA